MVTDEKGVPVGPREVDADAQVLWCIKAKPNEIEFINHDTGTRVNSVILLDAVDPVKRGQQKRLLLGCYWMIIHGLNLRLLLSFWWSCQRDGAVIVNRWQSGSLQLSGPQVFMGVPSTLQGSFNQELPLECWSSFYDVIKRMISETSSIQQRRRKQCNKCMEQTTPRINICCL